MGVIKGDMAHIIFECKIGNKLDFGSHLFRVFQELGANYRCGS